MTHLIEKFYSSFAALDSEGMCACYHPEASFYDHAFGELDSDHVKAMWTMLVESQRGKDFRIEYKDIQENTDNASANWEAHYTFSKTGRRVHNIINSEFELRDDLIYRQVDHFDVRRWASMALGWKGKLLGGTKFFRRQLQKQTEATLARWMKENSASQ